MKEFEKDLKLEDEVRRKNVEGKGAQVNLGMIWRSKKTKKNGQRMC